MSPMWHLEMCCTAIWPLTQNCHWETKAWHFFLQLFLPIQRACIHFHHVLLNSSEAALCAVENITECQNWDKLDRGHGKGAIMGDFAVEAEAVFVCDISLWKYSFWKAEGDFIHKYIFKYLSDDLLWVYYAQFSLTIVGIVYPKWKCTHPQAIQVVDEIFSS